MTPSLDGRPTRAKEAPSPHQLRLILLDTNPVFKCLVEDSRLTIQKADEDDSVDLVEKYIYLRHI